MSGNKVRRKFTFFGRVQGVGFRWHAKNFANANGLTGWIKNMPDGSVEMEVQGTEEKIALLIAYMERHPYAEIDGIETDGIDLEEKEHGFYSD